MPAGTTIITFLTSLGFTTMGVGASFILYRKFLELGGPDNYFPPQ
jgi:hypothetical protein